MSPSDLTNKVTRQRAGFTLLELLIVLAIIATLAGLLAGAVQRVRNTAARLKDT